MSRLSKRSPAKRRPFFKQLAPLIKVNGAVVDALNFRSLDVMQACFGNGIVGFNHADLAALTTPRPKGCPCNTVDRRAEFFFASHRVLMGTIQRATVFLSESLQHVRQSFV